MTLDIEICDSKVYIAVQNQTKIICRRLAILEKQQLKFFPLIPYTNPFIAKKSILPTENMDLNQKFLLIIDNHTKWHPKTLGVKGFEKKCPECQTLMISILFLLESTVRVTTY